MAKPSKKILLVEDDQFLSGMYKAKLAKENFLVAQAFDGVEGLASARAEKPDLIILDILMPKMHGVEVINRLMASDWGKNIPVIILTNLPEYPGVADFVRKGPYELVAKVETDPEQVVIKVKNKLNI